MEDSKVQAYWCSPQRAIEVLQEEVERLRNERRWIPVEERLPDVDEHVLACWVPRKDGMACAVIRTLNGKNVWTPGDQWTQCDPPAHWQPLPSPPAT